MALGTAGPNRDRRAEVVKLLSGRPDVAHVVQGHLDQNEFYLQFTQFQFVAAPGSHGQDTYRFWEAVALGAVPVTLRGPLERALLPGALSPRQGLAAAHHAGRSRRLASELDRAVG